jgi:hypothetical protein
VSNGGDAGPTAREHRERTPADDVPGIDGSG